MLSRSFLVIVACLFTPSLQSFQTNPTSGNSDLDLSNSPLRPYIESFSLDRIALLRYYPMPLDPARNERMKRFYAEWRERLSNINFESLPQDGKVDYVVFRNYLDHEIKRLGFEAKEQSETASYVPFAATIVFLEESRKKTSPLKPEDAAAKLNTLVTDIEKARRTVEQQLREGNVQGTNQQRKVIGTRASGEVLALRNALRTWHAFYDSYDPMFTWWANEPYNRADSALQSYASFLRERIGGQPPATDPTGMASLALGAQGGGRGQRPPGIAGGTGGAAGNGVAGVGRAGGGGGAAFAASMSGARVGATNDIVGNPIGREALMDDLAFEMIPYRRKNSLRSRTRSLPGVRRR